jgi:hypothetical protein
MSKCKHCGKKGSILTDTNEYVCSDCVMRFRYNSCDCGRVYLAEENKTKCDVCESATYSSILNNYSTKPRPYFKYWDSEEGVKSTYVKPPKRRYYGLELEYSYVSASGIHTTLKELYDNRFIYNKSDASLNSGVEIVTAPMDKKVFRNYFLEAFKNGFEYIKGSSYDVTSNAGLHIHVNKSSIPPMDRYKIHTLLNLSMSKEEEKIIYYLSGRQKSVNSSCDSHYFSAGSCSSFKYNNNRMRHIALNTKNDKTFEFRIFKATTNPEVLLSYVELVDKLLEFVNTNGIVDMRISNFILWLKDNTDNKVLLEKVSKIIKSAHVSNHSIPVRQMDFMKHLKGVSYIMYPKLIGRIEGNVNFNYRMLAKMDMSENRYYNPYQGHEPTNAISKILYNTYKRVMINNIMKEVNRCA